MTRTVLLGAALLALTGCLSPSPQEQAQAQARDDYFRSLIYTWAAECEAADPNTVKPCFEQKMADYKARVIRERAMASSGHSDPSIYTNLPPVRVPMIYPNPWPFEPNVTCTSDLTKCW